MVVLTWSYILEGVYGPTDKKTFVSLFQNWFCSFLGIFIFPLLLSSLLKRRTHEILLKPQLLLVNSNLSKRIYDYRRQLEDGEFLVGMVPKHSTLSCDPRCTFVVGVCRKKRVTKTPSVRTFYWGYLVYKDLHTGLHRGRASLRSHPKTELSNFDYITPLPVPFEIRPDRRRWKRENFLSLKVHSSDHRRTSLVHLSPVHLLSPGLDIPLLLSTSVES